ncbi:MAG TPA: thioredoxin domain-containing protein [Terrimicrobium sp.]
MIADSLLVEYGSYDCPHCSAANERITGVRGQFGNRLSYAFRQRPVTGSDLARRAPQSCGVLTQSVSTKSRHHFLNDFNEWNY